MYKKIQTKQMLSREVANRIKVLIQSEKLKPGDKLPNELELKKHFGVSRPTIREAVKYLISQNIIEIVRGKGTFVSQNPGISSDPLGLDFVLDSNLHLFLIEARLIIEPTVARLVAERAAPQDIQQIGEYLHQMEDIVRRHGVGMTTELEFHRSIASATKNPVIMRIIPVIMDAIVKTYKDAPRTSEDHRQAFEEHKLIYQAILQQDPDAAFSAMRRHLDNSLKRTLSKQKKNKRRKA